MTFLLCPRCRRAWTADRPASCCGVQPVAVSPYSGERRTWYVASIGSRAGEIFEAANYRSKDDHRASLARGVAARGNTVQGWRMT